MRRLRLWRPFVAALSVLGLVCAAAPLASAAVPNEEPIWVYEPIPPELPLFEPILPPPVGYIYGPCGAAVDSNGNFYISDYYHHAVDVWSGAADYSYDEQDAAEQKRPPNGGTGYMGSLLEEDPIDGPCGLALDGSNNLFVNNYHRNVVRFGSLGGFGGGTIIAGQGVDSTHPTGVDVDPANEIVYVDSRTYVAAFHEDGTPVLDGGNPLHIGAGSLEDGYGVAYSRYPGTLGRLYVPDAASKTIKVYDPAIDKEDPVAEIDGGETPNGEFVSLRNASIAIDRVSGEIYVVDNLQPKYAEKPNGAVYVFEASGAYEGHLKYTAGDALPVGLAVDNSAAERDPLGTQGRVYVTTGNTEPAAIYGYHAESATTEPLTAGVFAMKLGTAGDGSGLISSSHSARECAAACEETVNGGTVVVLTAEPDSGSAFGGWSGACSGSDPTCTLTVEGNVSATATFTRPAAGSEGADDPSAVQSAPSGASPPPAASDSPAPSARHRRHRRRHHRHRRHRHRRQQAARHHRAHRG